MEGKNEGREAEFNSVQLVSLTVLVGFSMEEELVGEEKYGGWVSGRAASVHQLGRCKDVLVRQLTVGRVERLPVSFSESVVPA